MQPPPEQDKSAEALKQAQGQLQQLQAQLAQKATEGQAKELENKKTQTDQAAQIDTLTTKQELDKQANQIAMDRKDLESKKALFQLEQKHAVEKVASNAQLASEKLTNQKNTMSDGEKTSRVAEHLAKGALTQIDKTVTDAVQAALDTAVSGIKQIEAKVGGSHGALLRKIEQDRKDVEKLIKKVAAPRRSKAVRDETGRISSVVTDAVNLDA
jgi:hypothetical protein